MRLDRAVAERELARSRSHAQQLVRGGFVTLNGRVESRPATPVSPSDAISVNADHAHYVSRAALKLAGALDRLQPLGLTVEGRVALDAGASTGGFTQVLLERGAQRVHAVDVGHDQLHPRVSADPRVLRRDGVNVRDLDASSPGAGVDLVVADLSFISLAMVIPALAAFASPDADYVLMIKPQFEAGRGALNKRGVVESPAARISAITRVSEAMRAHGIEVLQLARSPLPGADGNVEFFVWGSKAWQARTTRVAPLQPEQIDAAAREAVEGAR